MYSASAATKKRKKMENKRSDETNRKTTTTTTTNSRRRRQRRKEGNNQIKWWSAASFTRFNRNHSSDAILNITEPSALRFIYKMGFPHCTLPDVVQLLLVSA